MIIKTYERIPVNIGEAMRYSGCRKDVADVHVLMQQCIDELDGSAEFKVCYDIFDIKRTENALSFGLLTTESETVRAALYGCERVVVFGATAGFGYDRAIMKYSKISPLKALLIQGLGAERVESLCDAFCRDIGREYRIRPRVSPGYGDIPLLIQKDIFQMLDLTKKAGITLNKKMLMTPSKSVTAFFGIEK